MFSVYIPHTYLMCTYLIHTTVDMNKIKTCFGCGCLGSSTGLLYSVTLQYL